METGGRAEALDIKTARYLDIAFSGSLVAQATDIDQGLPVASTTFLLRHEPSRSVTENALGLYGLDRELRRIVRVLPAALSQMSLEELLTDAGSLARNSERIRRARPNFELETHGDEGAAVVGREASLPRPVSHKVAGLTYVDTSIGSLTDLLLPFGPLVEIFGSHAATALANALQILGGGAVAYKYGKSPFRRSIKVVKLAASHAGPVTLEIGRSWAHQFGPVPGERYLMLIRENHDGSVTGIFFN